MQALYAKPLTLCKKSEAQQEMSHFHWNDAGQSRVAINGPAFDGNADGHHPSPQLASPSLPDHRNR